VLSPNPIGLTDYGVNDVSIRGKSFGLWPPR